MTSSNETQVTQPQGAIPVLLPSYSQLSLEVPPAYQGPARTNLVMLLKIQYLRFQFPRVHLLFPEFHAKEDLFTVMPTRWKDLYFNQRFPSIFSVSGAEEIRLRAVFDKNIKLINEMVYCIRMLKWKVNVMFFVYYISVLLVGVVLLAMQKVSV